MSLGPDILEFESQQSQLLAAYFWQNYLTTANALLLHL